VNSLKADDCQVRTVRACFLRSLPVSDLLDCRSGRSVARAYPRCAAAAVGRGVANGCRTEATCIFWKQLSGGNGRLPLQSTRLRRHSLNFAHVSVVHAGYVPIVPSDRDRIPTRFGDNAAIRRASPRQQTRVPVLRPLDSLTVIAAPPVVWSARGRSQRIVAAEPAPGGWSGTPIRHRCQLANHRPIVKVENQYENWNCAQQMVSRNDL
jgi:hypothetical protein